jgi:hypothetical protein
MKPHSESLWVAISWHAPHVPVGYIVTQRGDISRPIAFLLGCTKTTWSAARKIDADHAAAPSIAQPWCIDLQPYGKPESESPMPGFVYAYNYLPVEDVKADIGQPLEGAFAQQSRPWCRYMAVEMAKNGGFGGQCLDAISVHDERDDLRAIIGEIVSRMKKFFGPKDEAWSYIEWHLDDLPGQTIHQYVKHLYEGVLNFRAWTDRERRAIFNGWATSIPTCLRGLPRVQLMELARVKPVQRVLSVRWEGRDEPMRAEFVPAIWHADDPVALQVRAGTGLPTVLRALKDLDQTIPRHWPKLIVDPESVTMRRRPG